MHVRGRNAEIDKDLYSSVSLYKFSGARAVFGGQVVGLALNAALQSSPAAFKVHSLHSYFLLPGSNALPIIFRVHRLRDGKTYSTRSVHAQQDGNLIFVMIVGLAGAERSALQHQMEMPKVPGPEGLVSDEERLRGWLGMSCN